MLDRAAWLKEMRRLNEGQEDLLAQVYDEHWGEVARTHREFLERFLDMCPPHARLLDAACGTGKYWPLILASGRTVFGIDQSQGALNTAGEKYPDVPSRKMILQEMEFEEPFSGAICMDALEMVPPDDWPFVLDNLQRAIVPDGYFYFTVEVTGEQVLQQAYAEGRQLGLPVVYGEASWLDEGGYRWEAGGCYHYYPEIEQVREWVAAAGFKVLDERTDGEYNHFLARKR